MTCSASGINSKRAFGIKRAFVRWPARSDIALTVNKQCWYLQFGYSQQQIGLLDVAFPRSVNLFVNLRGGRVKEFRQILPFLRPSFFYTQHATPDRRAFCRLLYTSSRPLVSYARVRRARPGLRPRSDRR